MSPPSPRLPSTRPTPTTTTTTTNARHPATTTEGRRFTDLSPDPHPHPLSPPPVPDPTRRVFLLAFFSDWLQGPYVYALYDFYGFDSRDIAILFIIGFMSSMVFGTLVGSLSDKYGGNFDFVLEDLACFSALCPKCPCLWVAGWCFLFQCWDGRHIMDHFSHVSQPHAPPHTHPHTPTPTHTRPHHTHARTPWAIISASVAPMVIGGRLDADWCLQSDVGTNSPL